MNQNFYKWLFRSRSFPPQENEQELEFLKQMKADWLSLLRAAEIDSEPSPAACLLPSPMAAISVHGPS